MRANHLVKWPRRETNCDSGRAVRFSNLSDMNALFERRTGKISGESTFAPGVALIVPSELPQEHGSTKDTTVEHIFHPEDESIHNVAPDGHRFYKLLIYWDNHHMTTISGVGRKKEKKHQQAAAV